MMFEKMGNQSRDFGFQRLQNYTLEVAIEFGVRTTYVNKIQIADSLSNVSFKNVRRFDP